MDWYKEFPRNEFLELVSSGKTEIDAIAEINAGRKKTFANAVIVQMQLRDPTFRESLDDAKKQRADVWHSGIIQSLDKDLSKDDVPAAKLKFDQRKYLAAIDNPEKYSEKIAHKVDIGINIFQEMKDLKGSDVQKIIEGSDPFAKVVEAEFSAVENESESASAEEALNEEDIFS